MTEKEYIIATNLAKVRIARRALFDCLFEDETEKLIDKMHSDLLRIELSIIEKLKVY